MPRDENHPRPQFTRERWVDLCRPWQFAHDDGDAGLDGGWSTDAAQVLVVRCEDQPADLTQPRGKQYWELHPAGIWYNRTTGIWQRVWLEPVAACTATPGCVASATPTAASCSTATPTICAWCWSRATGRTLTSPRPATRRSAAKSR